MVRYGARSLRCAAHWMAGGKQAWRCLGGESAGGHGVRPYEVCGKAMSREGLSGRTRGSPLRGVMRKCAKRGGSSLHSE